MKIRRASAKDIDQIYSLYQGYVLDKKKLDDQRYIARMQKQGFVLGLSDKREFLKRIKNSKIFNVLEKNREILGLIDINKEIYFPETATNIVWLDKKAKKEYFHGKKSITLHLIMIKPKISCKNYGKKLLEQSLEELKRKGYRQLFAIITTGPLTNYASIAFHKKMGFQKVCVTKPITLFGMKDYTSALLKKTV